MKTSSKLALWLSGALLLISMVVTPAWAVTPVTVSTGADANSLIYPNSRLICFSNGDYFSFFVNSGSLVYSSSPTGLAGSWSAPSASVGTVTVQYISVFCDGGAGVYVMWGDVTGNTQWDFRYGISSGGSITWSFAAISLTCSSTPVVCMQDPSITAIGPSQVYVAGTVHNSMGGGLFTEVWGCNTSPCSSTGNWADVLDDSTDVCNFPYLTTFPSNNHFALACFGDGNTAVTGVKTGASLSGLTPSVQTPGYTFSAGNCVTISDTIYCIWFGTAQKTVIVGSFTEGGGSWTVSTIATYGSSLGGGVDWATISTDGSTDLLAFYQTPITTTIDYQFSTNLGSTWSGDAAWVTGEATAAQDVVSTPNAVVVGVVWQLATSGNIRFASATLATTVYLYAQNFPSLTVMGNFVLVLIGILLVPMLITAVFKEEGDVIITLWLFGSVLGALLGSMASTQADVISGSYGYVPWGITFFFAASTVVWVIKGGGH